MPEWKSGSPEPTTPGDGLPTPTEPQEASNGSADCASNLPVVKSDEELLTGSGNAIVDDLQLLVGRKLCQPKPGAMDEAIQTTLPSAVQTIVDLMINSTTDKVRGNMARFLMQVGGYNAVQKVAVRKHVTFDYGDIKLLAKVMEEDNGD